MPDQDDYPTCKTCDKWHEPSLKSHDGKMRALCGENVPGVENLTKIAQAFDARPSELLDDAGL